MRHSAASLGIEVARAEIQGLFCFLLSFLWAGKGPGRRLSRRRRSLRWCILRRCILRSHEAAHGQDDRGRCKCSPEPHMATLPRLAVAELGLPELGSLVDAIPERAQREAVTVLGREKM